MYKLFLKLTYILLLISVFLVGYNYSTNEYTHYDNNECCLQSEKLRSDYYFHHDDFPHTDNLQEYEHIEGDHLRTGDHLNLEHEYFNNDSKLLKFWKNFDFSIDHFHKDEHIEIKK